MRLFRRIFFAFFVGLLSPGTKAQPPRQIAITLDDLPYAFGGWISPEQQQKDCWKILEVLDQFGVKCTGFVIGKNVDSRNQAWLDEFIKRGHQLGNHTFSHPDLNVISAESYISDITRSHRVLQPWLGKTKYFRYPYLRQGNTAAKRDSVARYLRKAGYQLAPVTIDNDEWVFNRDFIQAMAAGQTNRKQADRIGEAYLAHMQERTTYFEELATQKLGRPVKHILLLHLNSLNAHYLAELLSYYKQNGWQFIPLSEALQDSLYQKSDDYLGNRGVSVLERIQ